MSKQLFLEHIMERCEDVITSDKECIAASENFISATKTFMDKLPLEYKKEYMQLESVFMKTNTAYYIAIFTQAQMDEKD